MSSSGRSTFPPPPPAAILRPNYVPKGPKNFFLTLGLPPTPTYLRVWITGPPLPGGLHPPLSGAHFSAFSRKNFKCSLAWLLYVRDLGLESGGHMTNIPECFLPPKQGVVFPWLPSISIDENFAALTKFLVCKYWLIFFITQGMTLLVLHVFYYAAVQWKEKEIAVCSLNHVQLCWIWSMVCNT